MPLFSKNSLDPYKGLRAVLLFSPYSSSTLGDNATPQS